MIRVHVIARDNGAGLSRDLSILERALDAERFEVTISAIGAGGLRRQSRHLLLRAGLAWRGWRQGAAQGRFDVNLMDERVRPEYSALARHNVLMPHPEWFPLESLPHLRLVDAVFAKTRHAVPIFQAQGCRTEFIGFSSIDRMRRDVSRSPTFFHLGGRSRNKGSQALADLWLRHPDWPVLTLVQRAPLRLPPALPENLRLLDTYLDDPTVSELQNRNLFHLCPSDTEGFGHHLVEGMSVGAITLTTDAPPMNEMITIDRGVLVAFAETGTQALATTYRVDSTSLERGIERMLALDPRQISSRSAAARAWWEKNDRDFRARLAGAIESIVGR